MKRILAQINRRDTHPAIQFIKYALCGGVATTVDFLLFFIISIFIIQAVTPDDSMIVAWGNLYQQLVSWFPGLGEVDWIRACFQFDLEPMEETRRTIWANVNKTIAFMFSNLTAYILNVLWVFEPGRHSRRKELGLFYAVSGTSYVVGLIMMTVLIQGFGIDTSLAYFSLLVAAVMINYVCRKYIIFKG